MRVFYLLILIVLLFYKNAIAQTTFNADSSYKAILLMKDDTVKIISLLELGDKIEETDTALCNKVYSEAITTSKRINNTFFECKSLLYKGVLYKMHSNYDEALNYLNQAYQFALKTDNIQYTGKALANIANVYGAQENFEEALKANLEAITYIEKTNDLKALSLTYGNTATIFELQNLHDKALAYNTKALDYALQLNNERIIGLAYLNLSMVYANTGKAAKNFECCIKALQYLRNTILKTNVHDVYENIASYYLGIKDYKMANVYCDSSLQIAYTLGFNSLTAKSLMLKSMISLNEKNIAIAENSITQARKYVEAEGTWDLFKLWNTQMSNLENAKGNYKDAFDYYKKAQQYYDSIYNKDIQKNNLMLEKKYQSVKKQSEITQLEKEKQIQQFTLKQKSTLIYVLIGSIAALTLIVLLYYKNSKRKQQLALQTNAMQQQKIKELEQEKQLLAVNSVLQVQEAERTRMAKDLHDGLGGMLSGIKLNLASMKGNKIIHEQDVNLFNKSISQLDNAIVEMRRVAHNMMPEALLKFGLNEAIQDYCDGINENNIVKMKYTQLGLTQPLEKSVEVILYRVIQELSNNAIKHADAKNIFIQLSKNENLLHLTVEDDGKGFDTKQLPHITGAGLQNVQSRVDYLKGNFNIDSELGKGTSVNIDIPV